MPMRVEGARVSVGSATSMNTSRRSRGLADIAPQYVASSGLCAASELEGNRGTSYLIQHVQVPEGGSRFPKLDECAHFHYEHVEIGPIQIRLLDEDDVKPLSQDRENGKYWYLSVMSHGKTWMVRRSFENFRMLDQQLHRCIYDRKFSGLAEIPAEPEHDEAILSEYLAGLSNIACSFINCGPVLNWLEMDNRGRRLLVPDTDTCPINTPAVAAAYAVKKYQAQAPDELFFEIGDMISVIDMPPPEESIWWRGKREYMVGFFPSECVSVIGEKVPRNLKLNSSPIEPSKSVLRKHGKLIAFFRSFILSRPSRRRLKQSGILKERVFGCDLGEHLQNSGHDIPLVLKCCAEFIETHGIVDGIYRLSGINSNIIKLRNAFDEDRVPALYDDLAIRQDIHSVASLVKMYFRELPNPLCTYQLYHQFVSAVQDEGGEETRILKMRDVVRKLPPPHYRTLEYLTRHLAKVAQRGKETGMTPRNVAIVWAPNLLRCREFEVGGVAALQFVGVQAVVTEFLVTYVELIFMEGVPAVSVPDEIGSSRKSRPKSLAISTPTKLLPLEEAQNRILKIDQEYIEVGGGPASLPPQYHTVIDLPRKRPGSKRSPLGWRKFFSGRGSKGAGGGHQRKSSTPADLGREKTVSEADVQASKRRLRPAKSVESLNSAGETPVQQSPCPLLIASPNLLRVTDKGTNHNRSVSHESYFDTLQDNQEEDEVFESPLDISEIQINFDLEESEMRIFSEDETLAGSGSVSFGSPRPNKFSKSLPMTKRLTNVKLARGDDSLSSSHSADPSPKKQKTQETETYERSRLEERLSTSAGELQFIDSVSPDQIWVQAEVHPIQSPSPVSSLSHVSSLVPRTSPILPHIPHLSVKDLANDLSDTETTSLHSSTLTTPDTPLIATYTPLIESPDPPRPEERRQRPYHPYENVAPFVKPNVVLETSFDLLEPTPTCPSNRDSVGSVKYELISTESSCDSLIDFKRTDDSRNFISRVSIDQFPAEAVAEVSEGMDHAVCDITETADDMALASSLQLVDRFSCDVKEAVVSQTELVTLSMEHSNCEENVIVAEVSVANDNSLGVALDGVLRSTGVVIQDPDNHECVTGRSPSPFSCVTNPANDLFRPLVIRTDNLVDAASKEQYNGVACSVEDVTPSIDLQELPTDFTAYGADNHPNIHESETEFEEERHLKGTIEPASTHELVIDNQLRGTGAESNVDTNIVVDAHCDAIGESGEMSLILSSNCNRNNVCESELLRSGAELGEVIKMEVADEAMNDDYEGGGDQPGFSKDLTLDLNSEDAGTSMDVVESKTVAGESIVSSEENLSGLASIFEKSSQLDLSGSQRSSVSLSDTEESSETQVTEIVSQKGSGDILTGCKGVQVQESATKVEEAMETSENVKTKEDVDEVVKPVRTSVIPKPPRKVFREVQQKSDDVWSVSKPFMEIAKLDKSPNLRNHRRFSVEDQNAPLEKSVMATGERWPIRASTTQQEVIKVTARLSESLPVGSSKVMTSSSSSKGVEQQQEWLPQRSSSSGNVRQLLNKFEGCERPRTLERLSTRRAREAMELDLSDPERRERIEKYKEKRRTYLREKYRAELEAARRVAPFEKPPRKHLPATTSSAATGGRRSYETNSVTMTTTPRRSFESPTVSSLCRNSSRVSSTDRRSGAAFANEVATSPEKQHHSLDFVLLDSRELPKSPERKPLSPRRKASTPEATSPPYCIKDMAAKFEKRDRQSSQKQYLSSV